MNDTLISPSETENMEREKLILGCLAAADGQGYDPAQIQKLVFLYQEKGMAAAEAKPFHFAPYNFGPFDPAVYSTLERLADRGLVEIVGGPYSKHRSYRLSANGAETAEAALRELPAFDYLERLSGWVRKQSFRNLVAAVYKAFPNMKANSVFRD